MSKNAKNIFYKILAMSNDINKWGRSTTFPPWGKMKGGLFRENTKSVNKGYESLNEYIKISTAQRINT